jgi:hydroxypyruvate isomerase
LPDALEAEDIRRGLGDNGSTPVLHRLPAGNRVAGERGIVC